MLLWHTLDLFFLSHSNESSVRLWYPGDSTHINFQVETTRKQMLRKPGSREAVTEKVSNKLLVGVPHMLTQLCVHC